MPPKLLSKPPKKVNGRWYVEGQPIRTAVEAREGNKVYLYDTKGGQTFLSYTDNTPNYDTNNVGRYIIAVENPDSAGYYNGRWYSKPWADAHRNLTGRVWDSNQIGIGLDMRKDFNPVIQPYLHAIGNYKYVTESDEHYSRQKAIQSKLEELDRLINKKGIRVKNYSDNKRAMALGLMYHGFAGSMLNPNGPLTIALKNAFVNGTDKQFSDAIYNFYTKVSNGKFNLRAIDHLKFWSTRLKSGGKIGFYQEGGTYIPSNGDPYQIFNGFTPYTDGTEITEPAVPSDELIPIPEGNYYKVKSGDSLWAIAHKHGMSLSKLLKMNPELSIKSVIHPGDRIYTGDYTVIKKQLRTQLRTQLKTQLKTQWRKPTKEWDKKAPYEPAKSLAEYEYRRATSPEFALHLLAEYPRVVPESRKYYAKDYLGKFNQRLQYYPNPTSRLAATNWSANPLIQAINKEYR